MSGLGQSGHDGRYAIVTPYFQEPEALLRRCLDSVRLQSIACDHIVVADGHPQSWLDRENIRHIKLDKVHGDFGNTPRGLGALLAVAEGYDGIGLLDADNWLEDSHVDACLSAATGSAHCDYVVAQRRYCRPDGTIMPMLDEDGHVDTNCYFFLRGAYSLIPFWALMPREVSPICDRVFWKMLSERPLQQARVSFPTVNYHCLWESHYRVLAEPPPSGAKPNINGAPIRTWLNGLGERDKEIVRRMCGTEIFLG